VTLTNGFYPPTNANFSFLTCASRSGTFSAVYYPSNDVGLQGLYSPTNASIQVINVHPVIPAIGDATINELEPWTLAVTATDDDRPAQTLTYALTNSSAGAVINPTTGIISWTPSEAQGPSTNQLTVLVTDNGTPNLTVSRSFQMVVNEINTAPNPVLPSPQSVNEETGLHVLATATDSDLPANTWTFALVSGPPGLTVAQDGAIDWAPTEDQGPGLYTVTVSVTDTNSWAVNEKQLSTTNSFSITVNEFNRPPSLTVPANQVVTEQNPLAVAASATDPDLPPNPLTFELVSPPDGMTIDPLTGAINWTPTEAQGPNTYTITVRVTDFSPEAVNEKHLSDTRTFQVTVNESNQPPVLIMPTNQVVTEETPLGVTVSATDPDIPTNTLTFALLDPPEGMSIDPASGVISWTPTEAQGSNLYTIVVSVTDNSPEAFNEKQFSVTNSFTVLVNESNRPPVLTVPADQVIGEQTTLALSASATDPDIPANPLTFALLSPPEGMTIDPATGAISWIPTEAQGPNTYTITVIVTDDNPDAINEKHLSATNSFMVTVLEVNTASVLTVPADQAVHAGTLISLLATATDADIPTNFLTFGLAAGPAGLSVSPAGVISWPTTVADAGSSNQVQVRVWDDGTPSLCTTQCFAIVVISQLALSVPVVSNSMVNLCWEAIVGQTYRLQFKNSVDALDWLDLPGDVTATNTPAWKTDPFETSLTNRYYRIKQLR
jgi:hypothetical protein